MIETERLILRGWRDGDIAAHYAMCRDPSVAAMLGPPPSLTESADVVRRQNALLAEHGHCFWAMELKADARFAGWCGVKPGKPPIWGETEIGWSLASDLWGRGLAGEAAGAVLAWTWNSLDVPHVVAITSTANLRSQALMERLGMIHYPPEDFDDPEVAATDPLRRNVIYRIHRPATR